MLKVLFATKVGGRRITDFRDDSSRVNDFAAICWQSDESATFDDDMFQRDRRKSLLRPFFIADYNCWLLID